MRKAQAYYRKEPCDAASVFAYTQTQQEYQYQRNGGYKHRYIKNKAHRGKASVEYSRRFKKVIAQINMQIPMQARLDFHTQGRQHKTIVRDAVNRRIGYVAILYKIIHQP